MAVLLGPAVILVAVALAIGALRGGEVAVRRDIGLFTTLPIIWSEVEDIAGILHGDAPPHWARAVMERRGRLLPLDMLLDEEGEGAGGEQALPLPGDALLVMAQPRPLSPDENVALDDWVRAGGRLLLFADPMLTAHSVFPLGDRRRPQDMALLSPILARWGLELRFDEDQPPGLREVSLLGAAMPVNLAGHFIVTDRAADCVPYGEGLAVRCRVGAGEILALADAAILETGTGGDDAGRRLILERLLALAAR